MEKTKKRATLRPFKSAEEYSLFKKHSGNIKGSIKQVFKIIDSYDLDLIPIIDLASNFALSSIVIENLLDRTQLPASKLADFFEMTPKTLAKYKNEKLKLPIRYAELAVKLDILYSLGSELFGSTKDFNRWLGEESYGLNDKKPIEILNTVTGIDAVTDELKRIEYGATA